MSEFLEALQEKFSLRIQAMSTERDDQIYLLLADPDIRPIAQYLRDEFGARLVTVFAEDRRALDWDRA